MTVELNSPIAPPEISSIGFVVLLYSSRVGIPAFAAAGKDESNSRVWLVACESGY